MMVSIIAILCVYAGWDLITCHKYVVTITFLVRYGNYEAALQNQRTQADENPCSFQETRFQRQLVINVWVEIIGDLLLGPYELPSWPSWASYFQFLAEHLFNYWILHDGAPAYSCIIVIFRQPLPRSMDKVKWTRCVTSIIGPLSLLPTSICDAIWRALFLPNSVKCKMGSGMPVK